MSVHAGGGSPVARPQHYHTLPTAILSQAEQHDRFLKQSELKQLSSFFRSGDQLLTIVETLTQNAGAIVAAGASRIFWGGATMNFLEQPPNRQNLPGYTPPPKRAMPQKERLQVESSAYSNPIRQLVSYVQTQVSNGRSPLPSGFRPINVARYGPRRMKRSMRDLDWFLRYVTYAIAAGDASILTVNVQGLRGVIPEDVTEATVVGIRDMQWKALSYFEQNAEATEIVQQYFDILVAEYLVEKPSLRLRQGFSNDQQGLLLPESYALAAMPRLKFVLKPGLAVTEQQEAIQAAYRQVFERDITQAYGLSLDDLESKVKSGEISTKEFIRRLGKSRAYRREFYEPFVISRIVELAVRHFLGRGLSSPEEFQNYFEVITDGGLPALVDALVDSQEYSDYFGEETVPYLRGLGQEAQECRNWGPQTDLLRFNTIARKVPQFVTLFGNYQKPLPNQHPYGSGNDPLEIQFGAIFPHQNQRHNEHPAPFNPGHRRILISCYSGNGHGGGEMTEWGNAPRLSSYRVLKLHHLNYSNGHKSEQGASVNLGQDRTSAILQGAYRQIFGRDVYDGQHLTTAELKLRGGDITVREFVRQLAKSRLFRHLYWDSLYVTRAIEYIHRRLLGRPTHGRQEMSRYYDICANQGFYALVDALIDSSEYLKVFGEDTVPYERYVTPRGFELRSSHRVVELSRAMTQETSDQPPPFGKPWESMMDRARKQRLHDRPDAKSLMVAQPKQLVSTGNIATQLTELETQTQLATTNPEGTNNPVSQTMEEVST